MEIALHFAIVIVLLHEDFPGVAVLFDIYGRDSPIGIIWEPSEVSSRLKELN